MTFEQVPPRFDLILLGMGEDRHTASLFPGMPALTDMESCVATVASKAPPRVTLTYPVLNNTSTIAFLVSGANKADTLHRVIDEPDAADLLPATRVHPASGVVHFYVDKPAAEKLVGTSGWRLTAESLQQ